MNTMKPRYNRSRLERRALRLGAHLFAKVSKWMITVSFGNLVNETLARPKLRKLYNFCVYTGFLVLLVCLVSLTLGAEDTGDDVSVAGSDAPPAATHDAVKTTENRLQKTEGAANKEEVINGTAEHFERDEKTGITILTGKVEILRTDGYLNADKVTFYTDVETDETVRTIAEGNVEIRDADIFATCDYATMEHLENLITLEHNVVVLQNKDRLETARFKFNRTTGKQIGEGGVKFKVRVKQVEPVPPADAEPTAEAPENDAVPGEEKTAAAAPKESEDAPEKDADTGTDADTDGNTDSEQPGTDADTDDNTDSEQPGTDADTDDNTDSEQPGTDTDTENSDDADTDEE